MSAYLRLRAAGARNNAKVFAEANHHESSSRGVEYIQEKKQRFGSAAQRTQRRRDAALPADTA